MTDLTEIRTKIDNLDKSIQDLLIERANLAQAIGKFKTDGKYYYPEREAEILRQVIERNQGPLTDEDLVKIFKSVINVNRNLQHKARIAFLGPLGTFSHAAVMKQFGEGVDLLATTTIPEVLQAVEQKTADYGLVPIENSIEGVVNPTVDNLLGSPLLVCHEMVLPIHHYLLSRCENLEAINQVYSHAQPLAQCQKWLERNLPNAALLPVKSSAQACMLAAREANTAAIAGKIALDYHQLNILAEHVEDETNNVTRFYVVGQQATKSTGYDKTSLIVWLPHQAGSLAALLNRFAQNDINLSLLESRPCKQHVWEYIFFLEMEGHREDKKIQTVLEQLTAEKIIFKILGSYPRAI